MVDILVEWKILLPETEFAGEPLPAPAEQFRKLAELRHESIHYNEETESDLRSEALKAIRLIQSITLRQFGIFVRQPWFIPGVRGTQFVKKDWEIHPFVKEYYLPACHLVGPYHRIEEQDGQSVLVDDYPYPSKEISDDEFRALYQNRAEHMNRP